MRFFKVRNFTILAFSRGGGIVDSQVLTSKPNIMQTYSLFKFANTYFARLTNYERINAFNL